MTWSSQSRVRYLDVVLTFSSGYWKLRESPRTGLSNSKTMTNKKFLKTWQCLDGKDKQRNGDRSQTRMAITYLSNYLVEEDTNLFCVAPEVESGAMRS